MAIVAVYLVLFLALADHSNAIYCICNVGLSDSVLQKNIDYACGAGADCSPILQNGACYNPNTVKDHCNYAVNSYFQRKGQVSGSCDFAGTATTTQTFSSQNSACVYPASPSTAGTSTTPTITTPPSASTTPSYTTTPSTSTTTTGNPAFGLGPTGTTTTDSSKANLSLYHHNKNLFWSFTLTLLFSGPKFLWV